MNENSKDEKKISRSCSGMKAAVWKKYGVPNSLEIKNVEQPIPKKKQLLIKVLASSVTTADIRIRKLDIPFGFKTLFKVYYGWKQPRKPKFGTGFSGVIVSSQGPSKHFKVGDRVFGTAGMALGANAEYLCVDEHSCITKIPTSLSYEDAVSLIFGGITCIHFIENINLKGTEVLVNGVNGLVGSSFEQIVNGLEGNVTGVCRNGQSCQQHSDSATPKRISADDLEIHLKTNSNYDLIVDTVGNLRLKQVSQSLTPKGKFIQLNASLLIFIASLFNERLVCSFAEDSKKRLEQVIKMYEAGILNPIISKTYKLDDIVSAHEYFETMRVRGSVVLNS